MSNDKQDTIGAYQLVADTSRDLRKAQEDIAKLTETNKRYRQALEVISVLSVGKVDSENLGMIYETADAVLWPEDYKE